MERIKLMKSVVLLLMLTFVAWGIQEKFAVSESVMTSLSSFYYYYYGDVKQEGDYAYTLTDGKAEITKYTGAGDNVTIPGTLGGFPVTSIGDWVFSAHTGITSITIPEGVTSIGYGAFSHCYSLENISIPKGVASIGNYAFYNCYGLNNIILLPGLTRIGVGAFEGCTGLVSFTLPEGVTNISDRAFQYCTGLNSITIPRGVANIGAWAFCRCIDLTSINIPQTVTSIGYGAFSECTGLTNIIVAADNQNYTSVDGVLYNKEKTILIACPGGLTSINIPQGVTSIGNDAFAFCSNLSSINIPESVTSIGNQAFWGTGLTGIAIPEGVTSIGDWAFCDCSDLTSIIFKSSTTTIDDNEYTIPETTTIIGYTGSTAEAYAVNYGRDFVDIKSTIAVKAGSENIIKTINNAHAGTEEDPRIITVANGTTVAEMISAIEATDKSSQSYYTFANLEDAYNYNFMDSKSTLATDNILVVKAEDGSQAGYLITVEETDECFIATAAFGSKFDWPVTLLRQFRDQYMLPNHWGKAFVDFYYQNSPPIAAYISDRQPLKMLVRALLAPIIAGVYCIYHPWLPVVVGLLLITWFAVRKTIRLKNYV